MSSLVDTVGNQDKTHHWPAILIYIIPYYQLVPMLVPLHYANGHGNPRIITCMSKVSLPANLVYIIRYHYLQNWNIHVIEFLTRHLGIYHTILLVPMQVPLHYATAHANPHILTCMSNVSLPANLVYIIPYPFVISRHNNKNKNYYLQNWNVKPSIPAR